VARRAAQVARAHGVEPWLLFRCLVRTGPTSDLLDLVESGAVAPELVASYAEEAPRPLRALWFALAAQAAQARGEDRLLRELLRCAWDQDSRGTGVQVVLRRIDAQADASLRAWLQATGAIEGQRRAREASA